MAGPRHKCMCPRACRELPTWPMLSGPQATIEPNWLSQVPEVVRTLNAEMQAQLDSYEIEFYELVTPEKLAERGGLIKDLR